MHIIGHYLITFTCIFYLFIFFAVKDFAIPSFAVLDGGDFDFVLSVPHPESGFD